MPNLFDNYERAKKLEAIELAQGNPDALRSWYNEGAKGEINWGAEGDLTRCHAIASKYMDSDQAWGFCERRAEDVYGQSNRSHDAAAGQLSHLLDDVTPIDDSAVDLAVADGYKTKQETQKRKKCVVCDKGFLGQDGASTCGPTCRKRKSRA